MAIPKGAATAKCAFDGSGEFTSDNWNCVTAGLLREFAGEGWERKNSDTSFYLRWDNQSYAALFVPSHPEDLGDNGKYGPWRGGGFIAMTWYKHRGQTEVMIRVDPRDGGTLDKAGMKLTAEEAEYALVNLEIAAREP